VSGIWRPVTCPQGLYSQRRHSDDDGGAKGETTGGSYVYLGRASNIGAVG
jgi:hypothetical protein